jgi:4-hydroxyphenylpyruvate dioxygenase
MPNSKNKDIFKHISTHGDGVKVIALWVDNATKAWEETTKRGAKSYMKPTTEKDENGKVVRSGIHTYGDTVHIFVERKDYNGIFMPKFEKWESNHNPPNVGLRYIDHMVGNVGWNEMNVWAKFYRKTMGFANLITFDDKDISTKYTALMSKVMTNGNGRVKFPINEPAKGAKKSQIEEYLDFYNGAGVQHIAVATNNILETVKAMTKRGVEFLYVPGSYYDTVLDRVGEIDENLAELKDLGILVDRDDDGYLLQIFTKPLTDRPTLFFEIIQRKGAQSFGKGNFKALFESIEAEQERRGTL